MTGTKTDDVYRVLPHRDVYVRYAYAGVPCRIVILADFN